MRGYIDRYTNNNFVSVLPIATVSNQI